MPQGGEHGILLSAGKECARMGSEKKGGWQAMAEDRVREHALRRHVAEMVALESDIEGALENQREKVQAHREATAIVRHCHEISSRQRETLEAHLQRLGGDSTELTDTAVATLFGTVGDSDGVRTPSESDLLRANYTAFNYAAISYAALCEMGLRLYDPPLREMAWRHLQAYAEAAQQINQLIAKVVAWELQQQGLECRCICPMCSMGACGCVAAGTYYLNEAWRETAPAEETTRGFLLLPPRAGSPLALAGVRGGDRLLEVSDRPVEAIADIQGAIRKHALGEEVRVVVQHGSEAPREIHARHISDLPNT